MKITKTKLKQIIKEELGNLLIEAHGDTPQDIADRLLGQPFSMRQSAMNDWYAMAEADAYALEEFGEYYPHVPKEELPAFAQQVLDLVEG